MSLRNKKIIIAGGTGFIGQALAARWGRDNHVIILGRQTPKAPNNGGHQQLSAADGYNITYWRWDGHHTEKHWTNELEGCDMVINLAGRSVNCRYTDSNRQEIINSRIDATNTIGQAIREATVPPKLWINAASATIYRHAQDRPQDEYTGEISIAQHDFSVQVCRQWEAAFDGQRTPFTRKIALRTAITLGESAVMTRYLNLVKWGLGGRQGSGQQMFSWVHIDDVARAIEWCLEHPEMEGTYNLAAPGPVTNQYFMTTLRRLTGHTWGIPVPAWLLKIGALMIGTEKELVLKSRWVLPTKLEGSGFIFRYPQVEDALRSLVTKKAVH
jgi:uncharacterized protein (TIGR01777 family)